MGDFDKQFHEALGDTGSAHARDAIAAVLVVFKAVRRARTGHQMTEADADAIRGFPTLFTYTLPLNPFWAAHAATLGPQLQLAVMDWTESAVHRPNGDPRSMGAAERQQWVEAKQREVATRSTVYSFAVNAMMLSGGSAEGLRERLAATMTGD